MRELLKKRERENVKFLILMLIAAFLFSFAVYYPSELYIFDLPKNSDRLESVIVVFFSIFLFLYSLLKLNYSNEISAEDLKIIQEDKDYENFKYFLQKNKYRTRNVLRYDYFYSVYNLYEQSLIDAKDEEKIIKEEFKREIEK
ncbi:hypothetical protein L5F64_00230 [Aliarcobacter butzleri]|uniref:hypothetical protein n=1 Tax=Aliarcobacter butzleri TaxID=28197 RepID=UPI001EDA5B0E|nr:hypothetical protein [Aliarcobacter butzleri]MCG3711535.1 hypothetical protein [Aliarcobacter butzleri]MCG3713986.1 hypothetical protein [Aliarcobacter butzleri]